MGMTTAPATYKEVSFISGDGISDFPAWQGTTADIERIISGMTPVFSVIQPTNTYSYYAQIVGTSVGYICACRDISAPTNNSVIMMISSNAPFFTRIAQVINYSNGTSHVSHNDYFYTEYPSPDGDLYTVFTREQTVGAGTAASSTIEYYVPYGEASSNLVPTDKTDKVMWDYITQASTETTEVKPLRAVGSVYNGLSIFPNGTDANGPWRRAIPYDWKRGTVDVCPWIPSDTTSIMTAGSWQSLCDASWGVNENFNKVLLILQKWRDKGGAGTAGFRLLSDAPSGLRALWDRLLSFVDYPVDTPNNIASTQTAAITKAVNPNYAPWVQETNIGATARRSDTGDYCISHGANIQPLTSGLSYDMTWFYVDDNRKPCRLVVRCNYGTQNYLQAYLVADYSSVALEYGPIYTEAETGLLITVVESLGISSIVTTVNGALVTEAQEGDTVRGGITLTTEALEAGCDVTNIEVWYVIPGTDGERQMVQYEWTDLSFTFEMPAYPVFIKASTNYDPNADGGESGEDGGDGTYDDTSDDIELPPLPPTGVTSSGFITLFKVNVSTLNSLADYLWTSIQDDGVVGAIMEFFNKMFQNPMDMIISLGIVPSNVPASTNAEISFGGILNTGLHAAVCDSQWVDVDCGTVAIKEFWGSFLDYSPYTSISLFLPYVGSVSLDIDQCMKHSLSVKYRYDVLTGTGVAFVLIDGAIRYQYTCQCLTSIPITGQSHSQILSSVLGAVGTAISVGGLVAGGASAAAAGYGAMSVGSVAMRGMNSGPASLGAPDYSALTGQTVAQLPGEVNGGVGPESFVGDAPHGAELFGAVQPGIVDRMLDKRANMKAKFDALPPITQAMAKRSLASSVANVMMSKPSYQFSGSMGAASGLLGVQKPFLVIKRPRQSLAENYKHYNGYPSNMTKSIGSCQGYTEVQEVDLTGVPATSQELGMIYAQLKGGFYPS